MSVTQIQNNNLINFPSAKSAELFQFSTSQKPLDGLPGKDWPLNVQIQTQSLCNAACVMCPYPNSWNDNNRGYMEEVLFEKIIEDLQQYQLGKLCLYMQNEPFIDKRWFEWAETAIIIKVMSSMDLRSLMQLPRLAENMEFDQELNFNIVI